ncbi:MAG: heme ABC transporter permease CcmC, partial [Usitatibacteraceae bacterium]
MSMYKYASPAAFYPLAGKMVPWFAALAIILGVVGLYLGLFVAPVDFQQGETYRIIFIHVPASWMAMFTYLVMALYAILSLSFNTRLSSMMMEALAPTGAMFTALALWTGALWGKPTWGTYWAWDARMTSTLILLFLYIGYLALINAIEDKKRADKAGALLVIVGSVNVPIIYFSVKWWNTLHQGSTVSMNSSPKMVAIMLWGMLAMAVACWMYTIA